MGIYQTYQQDFRRNLTLALPIMAGQLGQVMVNFIDNIMVGRLGPEGLAAVSLSISIYISFVVVGMGISFALPPLIAQADGEGDQQRISRLFKHSLIINIAYAFACVLIIELGLPLIEYLGQDPEVVELARPYLRLSGWALIPMMLFQTLRALANGVSETMPPMIASLTGNLFNVLLNYMFIYGKLGAPALGVKGAALGTLIARCIMVVLLVLILIKWKNLWSYVKAANYRRYQSKLIKKVLSLGIPTSLQMFFEVSAFACAALIMGTLGAIPQAAHQIAINLASMTFLTCTGLGMAATIRVGNNLGRKDSLGVQRVGYSAILQVIAFMLIAAVVFVLFRNQLPLIYINDEAVITIASTLIIMSAIFQVSDGVQVVALGALRGLQDVKIPMFITFIAYWMIGIPTSFLGARYWNLGPVGVWLGLVLGLTVSALLLTRRFQRITNRSISK